MEKRLQTIRSRLRKLDELDDDVLSENEEAEFTYMTDVIKHIINNGTDNKCISDESIVEDEELKKFIEGIYNISNYFYYVSIFLLNFFSTLVIYFITIYKYNYIYM